MNQLYIIGYLTADPTTRATSTGKTVTTFTMGVTRSRKDANGDRQSDFFRITTWGATADFCGKYLKKGADGKAVVENDECVLLGELKCKCGFSHNVKEVTRRDGSGTATINEIRCYKLEIIGQPQQQLQQQPTAPPAPAVMPIPADTDDLPF